MNYPQARRKARKLFGKEGDARMVKVSEKLFSAKYVVGVNRGGKFIPLGAGSSWDEAFNNVKEVQHGEGEEVGGSGEAAGLTQSGSDNGEERRATDVNPTSSVQRVDLAKR